MAQAHLDRLTSIDAGFLHQEDGGAHMHIGGLGVLASPAPDEQSFRDHIAARLPLVPRYRQKIAKMPLGTGRPVWVEDSSFSLEYHVRHTALPAPGSEAQLLTLMSRIASQRLDRTKPLWELWLVEGLSDGRWAIISKTHHAMLDGVGGVDLLTALLDATPETREVPPEDWEPASAPGAVTLLADGAKGAVKNLVTLGTRTAGLALRPREAVQQTRDNAAALVAAGRPLLDGAPATPLNGTPGPHRLVELVRTPLADYRTVKATFGATVNDVVLTAVSGALGAFLEDRGVDTQGLAMRACVPVSVRTEDKAGHAGNEITIMMAPMSVGVKDPVERLALTRRSMEHLKTSRQAEGAKVLTSLENALPPVVLARASRLGFSSRMYNVLVTNVPGPQLPIFLMSRQLEELAPLAFLAPEHLLAIGIISYNGQVTYGLLSDADAVPDLAVLAQRLRDALSDLVKAAENGRPAAVRSART